MDPAGSLRKVKWMATFSEALSVMETMGGTAVGSTADPIGSDEQGGRQNDPQRVEGETVALNPTLGRDPRQASLDRRRLSAMLDLENETEPFIRAVLENAIDIANDRELMDTFCKVACHRDVGPLIKDWTRYLFNQVEKQDPQTDRINPGLIHLHHQLKKPEHFRRSDEHFPPTLQLASPLWRMLTNLTYVELNAWRIGAEVPVEERRRTAQKTLDDIKYVEKSQGIVLTRADELFVDEEMDSEQRLDKLRRRVMEIWKRWQPEKTDKRNWVDPDVPTANKRRRPARR